MSNGMITSTLPTIVGMGVVSKTAEVALTPRGRRAAARRRKGRGKGRLPKIHRGPRGGRYIIKRGRKVYI